MTLYLARCRDCVAAQLTGCGLWISFKTKTHTWHRTLNRYVILLLLLVCILLYRIIAMAQGAEARALQAPRADDDDTCQAENARFQAQLEALREQVVVRAVDNIGVG